MMNNRRPEIRFNEYKEEWKQSQLGDITIKIGSGKTPRGGSSVYTLSGIPFLRSQNIYNDNVNFSEIVYITEAIDSEMANSRVQKDDILLNITGASIGRSAVYESSESANVNQHVCIIRLNSNVDPHFLQLQLTSTKGQKQIDNSQAGGGREGLNFQQISKMKFFFPKNKDEQIRIGNFLKLLDNTIELQQQELTILKQTKQGFLQKMFPKEGEAVPEVRFPGFTDDWIERKLDSIVDRVKSYSLSRDVETNENTGFKYIHYGDIHTGVATQIDESSDLPNIKPGNFELLKKGDLVLADASEDYQGIAKPSVITIDPSYKLVSGLHTIALRPTCVDSLFLYYLINTSHFRRYGYKVGTGMKVFGISVSNLMKFKGMIPILEEQIQISNFFKQLDEVIALHEQELEALQETKKAFLQKMFV